MGINSKNVFYYRIIRLFSTIKGAKDQRLNAKHFSFHFNEWLVGFTDGDGTFSFFPLSYGKWEFSFKIGQSRVNGQLLHKIKKSVGRGTINRTGNTIQYRVRKIDDLINILFPIFDNYPLHTSKINSYNTFKSAVHCYTQKDFVKLWYLYQNRKEIKDFP